MLMDYGRTGRLYYVWQILNLDHKRKPMKKLYDIWLCIYLGRHMKDITSQS